jgi:hypothetical protein
MRRLLWSLIAPVPALAMALAVSPAASASTHASARASLDARAAAAARAALEHLTIGRQPDQRVVGHTHRVSPDLSKVDSFNWSGYADDDSSDNTYSAVAGDWSEPGITCTKEDEIAAFWVGIDGYTSDTVEQGGTLAQCFEGTAHYYSWWEMYPTNDIQLVGSTVKSGDAIAASVTKSGTKYTIKVTDSTTTANSFSTTQTCSASTCVDSSAEWIAEAPGGPRGEYPLPDFKTWNLTGATVTSGTKSGVISTFPDDEITMIDGTETYPLSKPGALNSSGNAFKCTWKNSY